MSPADAISTKPLLDKLGVKPGARVALIGAFEEWFRVLLTERASSISERMPTKPVDIVFLKADSVADLIPLARLRSKIVSNGAIWVVSRKGRLATLRDVDVIQASLDAGLVDNKVVSFSETQTSLRAVIRLRDRPDRESG